MNISERYKIFDAAALKRIAIISMLIDHSAAAILYNCIIRANVPISRNTGMWNLYQFYRVLRGVGRLAFPIFCFFIVEGFVYTHSRIKYLIRLTIFGILSELPFDLALFRYRVYKGHQNVMFEMALALVMLMVFELVGKCPIRIPELRLALQYLATVPFIVLADKLSLDYGFKGLMLILLLYILRDNRYMQCVAGALFIGLWEWPAVFSFVALLLYNGKRGKQHKYFFYVFYPGHLLILFLIAHYALGCTLVG